MSVKRTILERGMKLMSDPRVMSGRGRAESDAVTQRVSTEGADLLTLAGVNDANLLELSRQFGVKISLRGEALVITGESSTKMVKIWDADGLNPLAALSVNWYVPALPAGGVPVSDPVLARRYPSAARPASVSR